MSNQSQFFGSQETLSLSNRIGSVFFEDFEWATRDQDVVAYSQLTDKFKIQAGSGVLYGGGGADILSEGKSSLFFDISGTSIWVLNPRWYVDYKAANSLNIEINIKMRDTINNDIGLGFTKADQAGTGNIPTEGFGMITNSGSSINHRLGGRSSQTGANQLKVADVYEVWRVTLNMTAGSPDTLVLKKDGSQVDSIGSLTEYTDHALVPCLELLGAIAGDDFWLDYVACWAT